MSLGVESYSCILLATRNGNQQESNIVPVAAVTKVSAWPSTRVLTTPLDYIARQPLMSPEGLPLANPQNTTTR